MALVVNAWMTLQKQELFGIVTSSLIEFLGVFKNNLVLEVSWVRDALADSAKLFQVLVFYI